jgi:hypothetical protein
MQEIIISEYDRDALAIGVKRRDELLAQITEWENWHIISPLEPSYPWYLWLRQTLAQENILIQQITDRILKQQPAAEPPEREGW